MAVPGARWAPANFLFLPTPYVAVYRVSGQVIEVLRIYHAARTGLRVLRPGACHRYHQPVRLLILLWAAASLQGQTGANVLIVLNRTDPISREIAEYYRVRRSVPLANVCSLEVTSRETIDWKIYVEQIELPVADCLKKNSLQEQVLYIVTTRGVPLRVDGMSGSLLTSEQSSVDSDLSLLYAKLKGRQFSRNGAVANPFFGKRDLPFRHPLVPIYLVTRLAAYDLADMKAMVDRSLAARNRGKFVIDVSGVTHGAYAQGNDWLRSAALLLPPSRLVLDTSPEPLYDQNDVIGYAGWGSNDDARKRRWLGFKWLPGAIATDFVSTNARTFEQPPERWVFPTSADRSQLFGGSGQSLSADYLHEGATGASGNVYEPYLTGCARPEYLLPAYAHGRNLAESYYLAFPYLSWMGVVLGDPLCSLGRP